MKIEVNLISGLAMIAESDIQVGISLANRFSASATAPFALSAKGHYFKRIISNDSFESSMLLMVL